MAGAGRDFNCDLLHRLSPTQTTTRQNAHAAPPTLLTRPMPSQSAAQDALMGALSLDALLGCVEHLTKIQPY